MKQNKIADVFFGWSFLLIHTFAFLVVKYHPHPGLFVLQLNCPLKSYKFWCNAKLSGLGFILLHTYGSSINMSQVFPKKLPPSPNSLFLSSPSACRTSRASTNQDYYYFLSVLSFFPKMVLIFLFYPFFVGTQCFSQGVK